MLCYSEQETFMLCYASCAALAREVTEAVPQLCEIIFSSGTTILNGFQTAQKLPNHLSMKAESRVFYFRAVLLRYSAKTPTHRLTNRAGHL